MPAQKPQKEAARQQRRRQVIVRRRRVRFIGLLVLFTLALSAYAVMALANGASAPVSPDELLVTDTISPTDPIDSQGTLHPVFARLGETNLVLPVSADDATAIAYYSLSDEGAEPFEPVGSQVNAGFPSSIFKKIFSRDSSVRYYILQGTGQVVAKTGAVDIGASPGTPIVSPVSGVVSAVRDYKLYGKYDDVQIDIRPKGMSGITLTLLFVEEPAVTIGQTVDEGKTQLGKVRAPEGELGDRLAKLTHDEGAHVHLQATKDKPQ